MGHKTSGSPSKGARNVLGHILRSMRSKAGLSSEELSSRIELENAKYCFKVSADHLNKVERGEKPLTDFLLLAYSEALNFKASDILKEVEYQ